MQSANWRERGGQKLSRSRQPRLPLNSAGGQILYALGRNGAGSGAYVYAACEVDGGQSPALPLDIDRLAGLRAGPQCEIGADRYLGVNQGPASPIACRAGQGSEPLRC